VGNELYKKKLGVVGLGKIGSHVARVAKAMGMDVMAYDPFVSAERAQQMQVRLMQLPALFAEADYVSPAPAAHAGHRKPGERRAAAHDEAHGAHRELCPRRNHR